LFGFDQIIFQFNNSLFRRDDLIIKSTVGFGSLGLRLILRLSERRLRLQQLLILAKDSTISTSDSLINIAQFIL